VARACPCSCVTETFRRASRQETGRHRSATSPRLSRHDDGGSSGRLRREYSVLRRDIRIAWLVSQDRRFWGRCFSTDLIPAVVCRDTVSGICPNGVEPCDAGLCGSVRVSGEFSHSRRIFHHRRECFAKSFDGGWNGHLRLNSNCKKPQENFPSAISTRNARLFPKSSKRSAADLILIGPVRLQPAFCRICLFQACGSDEASTATRV